MHAAKSDGSVMILVILLLVVMASLTAAMANMAAMSYQQADAARQIMEARCQAEAGLGYLSHLLTDVEVPQAADGKQLLTVVAGHLTRKLDGTKVLNGQMVGFDGSQIHLPMISASGKSGQGFIATLTVHDADELLLSVDGQSGPVRRNVSIRLRAVRGGRKILDYGIAARGPIRLHGSTAVLGINQPSEGDCYSAGRGADAPLELHGHSMMNGRFDTANARGHVRLHGLHRIGGKTYQGPDTITAATVETEPERYGPFRFDREDYAFPQPEPGVFGKYAVNELSMEDRVRADRTLVNVRIPANTNPVFAGHTKIRGVLYIEQPNRVTFAGNCSITGVIATQSAPENDPTDASSLSFAGHMKIQGVEALPDEPQFAELRKQAGTFLLAPGFEVNLSGSLGVVSGAMAAEGFRFHGNVVGLLRGPMLSYGDGEFRMGGASQLMFDRSKRNGSPAGLRVRTGLIALPETYRAR